MSLEASNDEEKFVQQFTQHEQSLRAFVRSMGLDWDAVDDVMQTVSLVMWRKWSEFDPESSFVSWGRVIARFEVLKYRRGIARDRHVFSENVMDLLANAAEELDGENSGEVYRAALEQCLPELPPKSRELIAAAYEGGRTIKEVAQTTGTSATALYKALNRIRNTLQVCIERRIDTGAWCQ